jgi:Mor family transcriptional regulator
MDAMKESRGPGAPVRDRLAGMSLTVVARKYRVSRASVVRFVRQSQRRQVATAA